MRKRTEREWIVLAMERAAALHGWTRRDIENHVVGDGCQARDRMAVALADELLARYCTPTGRGHLVGEAATLAHYFNLSTSGIRSRRRSHMDHMVRLDSAAYEYRSEYTRLVRDVIEDLARDD